MNPVSGQIISASSLLGLTEAVAQLLVPSWKMNIAGMAFLFVPIGWYFTERIVAPRFGDWTPPACPRRCSLPRSCCSRRPSTC